MAAFLAHQRPQTHYMASNIVTIGDSIWYSTEYGEGENGMVEYNTRTHLISINKYPKYITPSWHSICTHNNKIYLINGKQSEIIIFDPFSNQRQFAIKFLDTKLGEAANCVVVHHQIHIFTSMKKHNSRHLIYDIASNQIVRDIKMLNPDHMSRIDEAIIVTTHQQIVRFGGYQNGQICDQHFLLSAPIKQLRANQHDTKIAWNMEPKYRIPSGLADFGYVLYRDYLILFGGTLQHKPCNFVHVLNLSETEPAWVRLDTVFCPMSCGYRAVIVAEDDKENAGAHSIDDAVVHLFTSDGGNVYSITEHYSISIGRILSELDRMKTFEKLNHKIKVLREEVTNLECIGQQRVETICMQEETIRNLTAVAQSIICSNSKLKQKLKQLKRQSLQRFHVKSASKRTVL